MAHNDWHGDEWEPELDKPGLTLLNVSRLISLKVLDIAQERYNIVYVVSTFVGARQIQPLRFCVVMHCFLHECSYIRTHKFGQLYIHILIA